MLAEKIVFWGSFRNGYLPELRTSCDKTSDLTQNYFPQTLFLFNDLCNKDMRLYEFKKRIFIDTGCNAHENKIKLFTSFVDPGIIFSCEEIILLLVPVNLTQHH